MEQKTENRIDAALKENERSVPVDETGMEELYPILGASKQVFDAAKISGFTDSQAMQFARDYFVEIMRHAAAQAQ